MLYTIQICTWSGISKKPCRLRFWPWIKANLWSCRDFWRILRLQNSFRSPNNLCFEWQRCKAFHVVCKRCITHMYIHNIPKWMDSLISHAPNYPNKLHTLIPHLWQYQKKHLLTSEFTGTILPPFPQKRHLFGERCITNLEEMAWKECGECSQKCWMITLPKFNIAPEKLPSQ